ncbi:MAG: C26 family cysteine hydrolase domain-containing family [Opitutae bacterium]|jgi:anthranilate synthase component 2|nr:C26 family cysteine hydrolase domain-containing family [Opitutae bacterium]
MILVVDHQDSFTRNLEHLLANFDDVLVVDRKKITPTHIQDAQVIVLSPGPGKPDDYPETQSMYREILGFKPILGICLGFQLILQEEGGQVIRQNQVLHGVETEIEIIPNTRTYDQIDKNLRVARYHSLQIEEKSLSSVPKSILITGIDPLRKVPLSFEDLERKLFGLQYHPESFLSKQGKRIIQNIHHACLDNIGGSNPTP